MLPNLYNINIDLLYQMPSHKYIKNNPAAAGHIWYIILFFGNHCFIATAFMLLYILRK
jgi:hypothetical protein